MTKEEQKNLQGVSTVQGLGHILAQSFDRMFNKSEDAVNEWIFKFNSLSFQELSAAKNNQQNYKTQKKQQVKKKTAFLKQNGKIKIKIEVNTKKQNLRQPSQTPSKLSTRAPQKDSDPMSFRTRIKSQNTQLKSLKKTNQLTDQKEEQENKNIILKQLTKRRLQLMERLKKIDAELIQVKRESSPPPAQKIKDDKILLYQSNINRSFIHNFNLSRIKKHTSQKIVEQHIKTLEMLEKINNQKIKRQQRIAAQFQKKQQQQIHKLQQIQKKRSMQLQKKKKRVQLILSKTGKSNKSKLVNQTKLNQFVTNQSQLIPTTIIQKQNIQVKIQKDTNFFDEEKKKTRMFTELDLEDENQNQNVSIKQQIVTKQIKYKQNIPDNNISSTSKHQIILSGKLQ